MKLYYHPFSQHARRVRVLCHELGLAPELALVAIDKGEHMSPQFLQLNPAHAVPLLDDAGWVLAESHAIMRYLCQRYGGERFYPTDTARRAEVDQWLDWTHCRLNPPVQTLAIQLMSRGDKADPAVVKAAREEAAQALQVLEAGLKLGRGVGGQQISVADIAAATTVALYTACNGASDATPRVRMWLGDLQAQPAFVATQPPALA
jgi:glutathione S-transferase